MSRYRTGDTAPRELLCGRVGGPAAARARDRCRGLCPLPAYCACCANGHAHTRRRPLRDNGVRYILETCRSPYAYAAKRRHFPPYTDNPFAGLGGKRARVDDAKPVFVFARQSELAFLKSADSWSFRVHFLLAKLGLRPGELVRVLIEDVDFSGGWIHVRSRPELGAHTKTRRERVVPLIAETISVVERLIGDRTDGPIVPRQKANLDLLPLANLDARKLTAAVQKRIVAAAAAADSLLDRRAIARVQRRVARCGCDAARADSCLIYSNSS